MQHIIQEFENIGSEPDLQAFLQKYRFRLADSRSHADQYVLGAFVGKIDERQAKITHRLFDAHTARLQNAERNQLLLEMQGVSDVEVRFRGNY